MNKEDINYRLNNKEVKMEIENFELQAQIVPQK